MGLADGGGGGRGMEGENKGRHCSLWRGRDFEVASKVRARAHSTGRLRSPVLAALILDNECLFPYDVLSSTVLAAH